MVIDTSAVMAILLAQTTATAIAQTIAEDELRIMSETDIDLVHLT